MAECRAAVVARPGCGNAPPIQGKAAMPTSAENHTAKRVSACCRGEKRRKIAASRQTNTPSASESMNRRATSSAMACRLEVILFLPCFPRAVYGREPTHLRRCCLLPGCSGQAVRESCRRTDLPGGALQTAWHPCGQFWACIRAHAYL